MGKINRNGIKFLAACWISHLLAAQPAFADGERAIASLTGTTITTISVVFGLICIASIVFMGRRIWHRSVAKHNVSVLHFADKKSDNGAAAGTDTNQPQTAAAISNALHLLSDPVFVLTPDTFSFTYLNKAARDFMAWSEDEYQAKALGDLNAKFDKTELDRFSRLLLSGERPKVTYELDIENTPYEVELQLIAPETGAQFFVAVTRNIAERRKLERAKDEFVATVSHELRSPLTSIKGAMGLILSGATGEVSDKSRSMLEIAHRNSDRLVLIINDILDYEKIAAGQMEFESEDIDVSQLLTEAITANQSYADLYNVQFKAVGFASDLHVSGDVERLFQVMNNLLSNAAKFSHAGGEVVVGLKQQNDSIEIRVQDSGSGIPLADQPAIFERYSQAKGVERRAKGGTGLGLSIVRAIVERHGGVVRFESLENVGTTFFVELPLKSNQLGGAQSLHLRQVAG